MKGGDQADAGYSHVRPLDQPPCLVENDYGSHGEYVGLVFKALEDKVGRFDYAFQKKCVEKRDFESLEMYVLNLLMGIK